MGLVVCVCDSSPVGIDVEKNRLIKRANVLANRFFSSGEAEVLYGLAAPLKSQRFLKLWVLKESFFKKNNTQLDLDGISFAKELTEVRFEMFVDGECCYFEQLEYGGYFIAVCSASYKQHILKKIAIEPLLRFWETQGGIEDESNFKKRC
jgi:phosphopantetheine--protein transferase-like protein